MLLVTQSIFYSNRSWSVRSFSSKYLRVLVGLQSLPAAVWKALCSSLGAHQSLQTLSLAGSAIGDATLQVSCPGSAKCVSVHQC